MEPSWDVAARSLGVPPDSDTVARRPPGIPSAGLAYMGNIHIAGNSANAQELFAGKKPSETNGFCCFLPSPPVIGCCQGDLHVSEFDCDRSAGEEWLT